MFTNDDNHAKKISIIANHGMETRYYHDVIDLNSRLDSLQAAILNVKLKYLNQYNQARYDSAQKYNHILNELEGIQTPVEETYTNHVFHQYTLRSEERRVGNEGRARLRR